MSTNSDRDMREIVLGRGSLWAMVLGLGFFAVTTFSLGAWYGKREARREAPNVSVAALPTTPEKALEPAAEKPIEKPESAGPTVAYVAPAVEPPAVQAPEAKVEPVKTTDGSGNFSVQVAAYRERKQAESMIKKLKAKGHAAFLGPNHVTSRGKVYRVWVGKFESREQAQKEIAKLHSDAFRSTFVVQNAQDNRKIARRTR